MYTCIALVDYRVYMVNYIVYMLCRTPSRWHLPKYELCKYKFLYVPSNVGIYLNNKDQG